jgi:hypothetical protein
MYPNETNDIQNTSLTRDAVVECISGTASYSKDQLRALSTQFKTHSAATDEAQRSKILLRWHCLLVGCSTNLLVMEEFLEPIPVHGTTTGENIFY